MFIQLTQVEIGSKAQKKKKRGLKGWIVEITALVLSDPF
jgi:hypothetical protein